MGTFDFIGNYTMVLSTLMLTTNSKCKRTEVCQTGREELCKENQIKWDVHLCIAHCTCTFSFSVSVEIVNTGHKMLF